MVFDDFVRRIAERFDIDKLKNLSWLKEQ
jgi:hypothetical protein